MASKRLHHAGWPRSLALARMLGLVKGIAKSAYGRLACRRQIAEYLRTTTAPRLNLGCGYNPLPKWLNVDIEGGRHGTVFMDANHRWPLPDTTFDAILCEHMIEHLCMLAKDILLNGVKRRRSFGMSIRHRSAPALSA